MANIAMSSICMWWVIGIVSHMPDMLSLQWGVCLVIINSLICFVVTDRKQSFWGIDTFSSRSVPTFFSDWKMFVFLHCHFLQKTWFWVLATYCESEGVIIAFSEICCYSSLLLWIYISMYFVLLITDNMILIISISW